MPVALLKNLSFRTSLYLMAEVVRAKSADKVDSDPASYQWFVEVSLAMPSDKGGPVTKKRVRFTGPAGPEEAHEALRKLVQEINELEEPNEDEEDEEDDGGDELDDISEVVD